MTNELVFLASGRTADVYVLDDDRVLRRYREDGDVEQEAAFMRHAGAHGYPVPKVYAATGADIEMQRLDGPTMRTALMSGDVGPVEAGQLLADLARRLHAIPALGEAADGECILHLDLHPDNVVLTPDGPMVIDWCNARNGPAALDLGTTAVILAQVVVDPGYAEIAEGVREVLRHFVAAAPETGDLLDAAVARRSRDRALSPAEVGRLTAAEALIRQLIASAVVHPD